LSDTLPMGIIACCCMLVVFIFFGGMLSGDHTSSYTDINTTADLNDSEMPKLEILNMTNVTINASKVSFVYYDHNSTKWNGCYGLNYTVLEDRMGNRYMLDHATTDMLGENTNYTFRYADGIGLVFDNNTSTEIYNNTGLYYVHEVRDDKGEVVKSLDNFTLYDKSHEPQIIPDTWTFVYSDHNSTSYEGDEGLRQAITHDKLHDNKKIIFDETKNIIGLAYYCNKDFSFYKYGISGLEIPGYGEKDYEVFYAENGREGLLLPNGTYIKSFDIYTHNLLQKQKDFISYYDNRIGEVRQKEQIDAMDADIDDAYSEYIRYKENHNSKPKYSTYYGTNGYGVIRSY